MLLAQKVTVFTRTIFDHKNYTRRVFVSWSGDIVANNATAIVVIDSPKRVVANWRVDYTNLFVLMGVILGALFVLVMRKVIRRRIGPLTSITSQNYSYEAMTDQLSLPFI